MGDLLSDLVDHFSLFFCFLGAREGEKAGKEGEEGTKRKELCNFFVFGFLKFFFYLFLLLLFSAAANDTTSPP